MLTQIGQVTLQLSCSIFPSGFLMTLSMTDRLLLTYLCAITQMLDATAIKTTLTQNGVAQSPCHYDIYGKIEIMSVDDDPINQMVIENLLQPYGYVLTICMDGMQCLELIASRGYTPDLLMLGMLLVRRVPAL